MPEEINYYKGRWSGREVDNLLYKAIDEVRPNFLDNWLFVRFMDSADIGDYPINQRGQTTYNAVGYCIDRWKIVQIAQDGYVEVHTNNGLFLSAGSGTLILEQKLEDKTILPLFDQNVSLSMLGSGTPPEDQSDPTTGVYFGMYVDEPGYGMHNVISASNMDGGSATGVHVATAAFSFPYYYEPNGNKVSVRIVVPAGMQANIYGMKLELGVRNTLAIFGYSGLRYSLFGEGVQITNVPRYAEELFRCITSTADPSDVYANKPVDGMGLLYFTGVTVSALTGDIVDISDARITSDYVLLRCEIANPRYITTDLTWSTDTAGHFTLNGTCVTATTAKITLGKKGN